METVIKRMGELLVYARDRLKVQSIRQFPLAESAVSFVRAFLSLTKSAPPRP
jgi:hypothetical protein